RDDVGDSLKTALNTARKLKNEKHAKKVVFVVTHAVHSKTAKSDLEQVIAEGLVDAVYISDSRPLSWEKENRSIHIVKVGETIGRISASLLEKGRKGTEKLYGQHLFHPKHHEAMLKEVVERRTRAEEKKKRQIPHHKVLFFG
ncbi:hypothetical protein MUP32_02980, partial [Candidatus Microgenomates bacterium]|nr:hypothetical protein [Candidatus Microgenomates bacterium]